MVGEWLNSILALVYPKVCGGCGGYLVKGEKEICTHCAYSLSRTGYHNVDGNDAEKLFWNKVPVAHAAAYCHFHKGGIAQQMIHNLKYKGAKGLGYEMGCIMGREFAGSALVNVDYIVPVPLHPSKLKKRHYNQAEEIASGLSSIIGVPVDTSTLIRVRENATQTDKNINERYKNSLDLFGITGSRVLEGKSVLIVDDVITTGATLEACARELFKIPGISVNCATFAISSNN